MKINTINEFKKFIKENSDNDEARNVFMGILTESLIQQIESTFKVSYGVVTQEDNMYYMQLYDQQGKIVDRIVYHPTGQINSGAYEWWTANSTATEKDQSFETYNQLALWFNSENEKQLPILNL